MLRLVGIPLALVASIVLARTLSVSEFGIFSFTISLVSMLSIPVSGGLPILLTREVAGYARTENWAAYRGLLFTAHLWVVLMAAAVGAGLLCWWLLSERGQAAQLLFVALMLPLSGFIAIRTGVLKGLGHPVLSEAPSSVLHPALLAAGYTGLAVLGISSFVHALWWYFTVMVVVTFVGAVFLLRTRPAGVRSAVRDTSDKSRWRKGILPLALLSGTTTFTSQITIVLLGVLGSSEAVAHMSVAERAGQLVVLPLMVMNAIIAPYFVNALHSGSRDELSRVARYSARLTFAVSLPVAAILILFGDQILFLTFGAEYAISAYMPMLILLFAQLLSAAMGASGYLLAMSGYDRLSLISQILGVVVLAVVVTLLVPKFGAVGAAYGVAAGILVPKVANAIFIWRKLGIRTGIA